MCEGWEEGSLHWLCARLRKRKQSSFSFFISLRCSQVCVNPSPLLFHINNQQMVPTRGCPSPHGLGWWWGVGWRRVDTWLMATGWRRCVVECGRCCEEVRLCAPPAARRKAESKICVETTGVGMGQQSMTHMLGIRAPTPRARGEPCPWQGFTSTVALKHLLPSISSFAPPSFLPSL